MFYGFEQIVTYEIIHQIKSPTISLSCKKKKKREKKEKRNGVENVGTDQLGKYWLARKIWERGWQGDSSSIIRITC